MEHLDIQRVIDLEAGISSPENIMSQNEVTQIVIEDTEDANGVAQYR